jgi:glutathione peroxidase
MKTLLIMLSLACFTMAATVSAQEQTTEPASAENSGKQDGAGNQENTTDIANVPETLQFKMKSIDGKEIDLAQYAGKVVVIVNTASRCGMTPQYKDLQELHAKYSEQGLVILGFPCNQFGGQEPGSEADIKTFCSKNYGVEFDMFAKVDVNGKQACDLFKLLTALDVQPAGAGEVRWNFEKFVLDKSGKLVARFGSRVKPGSEEFVKSVEEQLAK